MLLIGSRHEFDRLLSQLENERPLAFKQEGLVNTQEFTHALYKGLLNFDTVSKLPHHEKRNRQNILNSVYVTWIEGFLHNSVYQAVELELGLEYKPESVSRRPWNFALKQLNKSKTKLPTNQSILDIFEKFGRSLLILGEPGSGKTITLLQLASKLITLSQRNELEPIPIILNLSSWHEEQYFLEDWLVEEMLFQYQVARKTSRLWIKNNQLLLLLDGLDEINKNYREDCILAINEFKARYPVEIVVCSRTEDYNRLNSRLNFTNAILIQPLSDNEIKKYLAQFGNQLSGLQRVLDEDDDLYKLAMSPLMLSIMPIAYDQMEYSEIIHSSLHDSYRHILLTSYVTNMLERRLPIFNSAGKDQSLQWLSNLAFSMVQHNQSIYYIERLQPNWFSQKIFLYKLLVGLSGGSIFGLSYGLINGLVSVLPDRWLFGLKFGYVEGFIIVLISMFIFGLCGAISGMVSSLLSLKFDKIWQRLIIAVLSGCFCFYLALKLITWFSLALVGGLFFGVTFAYVGGPMLGVLISLIVTKSRIDMVEAIKFSIPTFEVLTRSVLRGLGIGVITGLVIELLFSWRNLLTILHGKLNFTNMLDHIDSFTILFVLIGGGIVGALVAMIHPIETDQKLQPNQGIHTSYKNALLVTLIGPILACVIGLVVDYFFSQRRFFLLQTLSTTIIVGWFYFGGFTTIQHYILRFLMAKFNYFPLQSAKFLDEMVNCILLRRLGGGWIFIHRYLLDYFAFYHDKSALHDDTSEPDLGQSKPNKSTL